MSIPIRRNNNRKASSSSSEHTRMSSPLSHNTKRRNGNTAVASVASSSGTGGEILPLHAESPLRYHHGGSYYRKRRRKTIAVVTVSAILIVSTIAVMTILSNPYPILGRNIDGKATKTTTTTSSLKSRSLFSSSSASSSSFFSSFKLSKRTAMVQTEPIPDDWIVWDVVVVGAGPAGLTAALFCARAGLSTLVLGSTTGMLSQTKHLDNYPSYVGNDGGPGWLETTKQQAVDFGTEFVPPGILVESIVGQDQKHHGLFVLKTDEPIPSHLKFTTLTSDISSSSSSILRSWSVIVASGATPKKLGLEQEDELWGKSLHSCAICDGHLYQDQVVLVVGGGDAAIDAALMLSRFATRVIVVHRRTDFSSAKNHVNLQLLKSTNNIEIKTPYIIESWETIEEKSPSSSLSSSKLKGAKIKRNAVDDVAGKNNNQGAEFIEAQGAFIMIGATPNTEWLSPQDAEDELRTVDLVPRHVTLDSEGLIQVVSSTATQTAVDGIFAAGEVVDKIYKQAITASAQGAQAAIDAERWLRDKHHQLTGVAGAVSGGGSAIDQMKKLRQQQKAEAQQTNRQTETVDQQQKQQSDEVTKRDDNVNDCDLTDEQCIRSIIKKYPVVIFSKSWCPYCRKAMEALSLAGIRQPHVIDLTQTPNSVGIQGALQRMTGRRTVPNVFVGGTSIGGGDETTALQRQGKLVPLLQDAGAFSSTEDKEEQVPHQQQKQQQQQQQQRQEEQATTQPVVRRGDEVSCDLLSEECFDEITKKYPVIMFSLSWCPECKRSLELLDRIGVPRPYIVDLDDHKEIALDIRGHMLKRTGRNQVPNLWVGGEWVGGYARMQDIHSRGDLIPMFEKVGIIPSQQQ